GTACDDLFDLLGFEIVCRKPLWVLKDQLLAIRCIGVLVKIKRLAARVVTEAYDAVTGVFVDPFTRKFLGGADGGEREQENESYQVLHSRMRKKVGRVKQRRARFRVA